MTQDDLPPGPATPADALSPPADAAGGPAPAVASGNTLRAYAQDWADFSRWCRLQGRPLMPPAGEVVARYLSERAGTLGVASLQRRLAGIGWGYRQRGLDLDRRDPGIAAAMRDIRNRHARPPMQKAPVSGEEILAMAATLPRDLRGARDRAILLTGFAGALRRSELVGLDRHRGNTAEGRGWVEILEDGALVILHGKTGWREVEIGRGSSERSCPVAALERWLDLGRLDGGALFRRVSRDGRRPLAGRLNDRHIARLVKSTALAAGLRPDLPEAERAAVFSGHSLRAGLANHSGLPEGENQRQLGHALPEPGARDPQRPGRFRVNLTRAAGL
ncbi:site-specific integrase [Mangrovicoccus algicola]|uniref:Integrase n=1 Tax=Mangrovicoccus algicola TaxID=2771008 RepID=A0A8J6ZFE1_9RHOB|nr:tyrosine-type recombinase/integrase [Mangrovicoccus algicola]MBE3640370.1 integrase [Mangrovicoccus algicola]